MGCGVRVFLTWRQAKADQHAMMPRLPATGELIYSVRECSGQYYSRDVPGGVESSLVHSELWRIAADGSNRRRLPVSGSRAEHPVTSPDGHWIYYQTEVAGRWQIHRMRTDGGARMTVAPLAVKDEEKTSAFGIALTADGTHLTYTLHDGFTGQVVRARSDGTAAQCLAPNFGYTYMAAPDATAKRVVFSGPARDYRLILVGGPEDGLRVLTPDHPNCYVPQFTPDGQAIIFIRRDGGLYQVASDGSNLRQMADGVQVEFFLTPEDTHGSTDVPAISPDGQRVAFIRQQPAGPPQLTVFDRVGGELHTLTALPGACARPAWSPDGSWLAFVSMVKARPQLFVMAADGFGPPQKISDVAGAVYALCWRHNP